jgi:periplasmic protein TonB
LLKWFDFCVLLQYTKNHSHGNQKIKKADLERNKVIFLEIGFVIVLSMIFIAFEWTSASSSNEAIRFSSYEMIEIEEIISFKREEKEPEVKKLEAIKIINLVPDDVELDETYIFDVEANEKTSFIFTDIYQPKEDFDNDTPFIRVEEMPKFNGGDPSIEFRKYIGENLIYPEIASSNGISGRVMVQFVVNKKGRVENAVIFQGVNPALDKEAIRVIMSSPTWTPGKQRGKEAKVQFIFPINFVLQ